MKRCLSCGEKFYGKTRFWCKDCDLAFHNYLSALTPRQREELKQTAQLTEAAASATLAKEDAK